MRTAVCIIERVGPLEFAAAVAHEDDLCDAVADFNVVGCIAQINEQYHDFAAVVGVDGTW